jgi:hypothetical protein
MVEEFLTTVLVVCDVVGFGFSVELCELSHELLLKLSTTDHEFNEAITVVIELLPW